MKKVISCIISILILLSVLPLNAFAESSNVTSGKTGDCTWKLDGTVLTISGNGKMDDYDYTNTAPWGKQITIAIIEDGVTNIGNQAFKECKNLEKVSMQDSVQSIGSWTFSECFKLDKINLSKGIVKIGEGAFSGCEKIMELILPDCIKIIEDYTFRNCESLTKINIPQSTTRIGYNAFCRCLKLNELVFYQNIEVLSFSTSFQDCIGLKRITVLGNKTHFTSVWETSHIEEVFGYINSTAEKFAEENSFVFIPLDEPKKPQAIKITTNSVILEYNSLYEYSLDTINWQNSNLFDGLIPGTEYRFYQRIRYKDFFGKSSSPLLLETPKNKPSNPYEPKIKTISDTVIVLDYISGYEYSNGGVIWQNSNIFKDLKPNTKYTFYQRIAESKTTYESEISRGIAITTLKSEVVAPSPPELISKTYSTVTLKANKGYEYRIDDEEWQQSNVFSGLIPDKTYKFYQRIAETETTYASKSSAELAVFISKLSANDPISVELVSKTDSSVNLKQIDGYEYKMDNGEWQKGNIFSNLDPDSMHKFYQRVAETDTMYASKSSDALSVKTFPKYYCTECLNTGLNSDKTKCETCFGTGRFHMAGDADSDYEITDWDSVLCKRYLAGWDVEIFSKKCFDIDGDRKVTDWDGVLFERYLAGWETNTKICSIVKGYPKHNHILGDWIIDRESTCVLAGEEYKICSICDDIIEERIISKLPHNFENWITDKVSTCYATGEKHHICKECGYSEINVIPKKSHSYGDWIIDKAATCSVFGSRHKVCSVCGASSASESFRELHKYGVWTIDVQPTCSHAGSRHRECTICKEKNVESIKQLEHSPGSVTYYDKESTCISHGTGYRLCTKCGGRCNGFQLPLKPHNYVNGKCTYCNQRKN